MPNIKTRYALRAEYTIIAPRIKTIMLIKRIIIKGLFCHQLIKVLSFSSLIANPRIPDTRKIMPMVMNTQGMRHCCAPSKNIMAKIIRITAAIYILLPCLKNCIIDLAAAGLKRKKIPDRAMNQPIIQIIFVIVKSPYLLFFPMVFIWFANQVFLSYQYLFQRLPPVPTYLSVKLIWRQFWFAPQFPAGRLKAQR